MNRARAPRCLEKPSASSRCCATADWPCWRTGRGVPLPGHARFSGVLEYPPNNCLPDDQRGGDDFVILSGGIDLSVSGVMAW